MAQILEAGKNIVITCSLYHLNKDITRILKLWKYLVITLSSKDTREDIQHWYYTSNEIREESCHFLYSM